MPAEWESHEATWLAWPHFHGDWPGKFESIPWVYAEIIRNLSRNERVGLDRQQAGSEKRARKTLQHCKCPQQKRPLSSLADRSSLDPRLAAVRSSSMDQLASPLVLSGTVRQNCERSLALQRLGKVFKLRARQENWRDDGPSGWRPRHPAQFTSALGSYLKAAPSMSTEQASC